MSSNCKIVILLTIYLLNINHCYSQEPIDIANFAKDKINTLEKNGRITRDYTPYPTEEVIDNEEYDFIIVGAGSSGSLIANRLSSHANWKILLLEAGGEPDVLTEIPLWAVLPQYTENNWKYQTEPEVNGSIYKTMLFPRGKGLGGTSLLNFMVYSRGQKENYDSWGINGWSYDDLLPYFKQFEKCKLRKCDETFRGTNGEVHVEQNDEKFAISELMVEAAKNSNYSFVQDYNGDNLLGVTYAQASTTGGQRCSSERAFLRPIRDRKSLTIHQNSHVTKVLLDENKRAYAVTFTKNSKNYTVRAKKEIILSAGAINSPQILMLSGIGPKDELQKHEIKLIQELPVGKKLLDHTSFWGIPLIIQDHLSWDQSTIFDDETIEKLYNKKAGVLKKPGGFEALLFASLRHPNKRIADVEIVFQTSHVSSDKGLVLRKTLGFSDDTYDYFKPLEEKRVAGAIVIVLNPKSHGRIELKSGDPFDHPKIIHGYFSDPRGEDMKTMIAGIREARRILRAPPLHNVSELYDAPVPGCVSHEFDSDEYWECSIRYLAKTVYHQSSTCKMGRSDDPEAVVDPRLRVIGVSGLRVADISILPDQISGHTNVPAFMIGEKLSTMIMEEYKIKSEL